MDGWMDRWLEVKVGGGASGVDQMVLVELQLKCHKGIKASVAF